MVYFKEIYIFKVPEGVQHYTRGGGGGGGGNVNIELVNFHGGGGGGGPDLWIRACVW